MKPEEKAKELVDKFDKTTTYILPKAMVKQLALICVVEQINFIINYLPLSWDVREIMIDELKEVNQEIQKL